uniref:Uncharacterized protein n=1 Tax=Anguilla anguilla TaxID=7936 RepID=A0A0E9WCT4_ANGAN
MLNMLLTWLITRISEKEITDKICKSFLMFKNDVEWILHLPLLGLRVRFVLNLLTKTQNAVSLTQNQKCSTSLHQE